METKPLFFVGDLEAVAVRTNSLIVGLVRIQGVKTCLQLGRKGQSILDYAEAIRGGGLGVVINGLLGGKQKGHWGRRIGSETSDRKLLFLRRKGLNGYLNKLQRGGGSRKQSPGGRRNSQETKR